MDAREFQSVLTGPLITTHFSVEWSADDRISVITEKGLQIMNHHVRAGKPRIGMVTLIFAVLLATLQPISANDITAGVFGSVRDVLPAAFGDFDSDELTDMFVLKDMGQNGMAVEIMLASNEEPLLRPNKTLRCEFPKSKLTSVVPGDFDGDALMDLLVTGYPLGKSPDETHVYILWGGMHNLTCAKEDNPSFIMKGEPLAIDYDGDMIIDLFGADEAGNRTFWLFKTNRTFSTKSMVANGKAKLRNIHSHAFLDVNGDFAPDLILTSEEEIEVWYKVDGEFRLNHTIKYPPGKVGQTLYLDVEMKGKIDLVVPVCLTPDCKNSTIFVHSLNEWYDLKVNFKENDNNQWGYTPENSKFWYTDAITLRGGDFNMDGYPDLLASLTLQAADPSETKTKAFLLENVPCSGPICNSFGRTFAPQWGSMSPTNSQTNMAVFYDFGQDGILDVLLVQMDHPDADPPTYQVAAYKNSLDYDANFVKVMVLTGRNSTQTPPNRNPLSKKKIKTFGTNLPGPTISYRTTTQEGNPREATSSQLPQSAHFSLGLPYSIFGLGRTPNFVDKLSVGMSGQMRDWTQIIPNSQMVVIPVGEQPSQWKAQLFVTPSKLVLMSVVALLGTCAIITLIIGALYWKERREDKLERLQEAHRFHFDAM
ncbi:T-cell immunomodulatory protein [Frankliniella fusca]|uniref:T-cell immunomodulatory protein n=1 Tax=Frankliniella fusca TaxID=407009 RepID=A0AAE1H1Q5_9NEOP|nr:T-cell immunomodulatory protein [Frankliniella fusca]